MLADDRRTKKRPHALELLAFGTFPLLLRLLPPASCVPLGLTDTGIFGAIGAVQCSTERQVSHEGGMKNQAESDLSVLGQHDGDEKGLSG